jgi:hypothetical protein
LIPWSYSFLNDLSNCPHKAMRKYVKRDLPKETSPELEEGIRVHKLFENTINGPKDASWDLPPKWWDFVKPLVGPQTMAEVKLGMTREMNRAPFWDDRRTGEQPWGRGKADVLILKPPAAFIVDWKTGKVREDDRELRQLALLVRANYPEVTRISGCYVWLKEGRMGVVYDLSDVNRTYHGTVASMAQAQGYADANDWPKTPNPLCGFCPVKDCQFNYDARVNK